MKLRVNKASDKDTYEEIDFATIEELFVFIDKTKHDLILSHYSYPGGEEIYEAMIYDDYLE